jgi:hypothetical protein
VKAADDLKVVYMEFVVVLHFLVVLKVDFEDVCSTKEE